jgi:hypothetical protein
MQPQIEFFEKPLSNGGRPADKTVVWGVAY